MVSVNRPSSSVSASDPTRDAARDAGHTVRAGDNLSAIAAQHGVTLQQLIAANPQIKNPNLIHPGQVVNLPGQAARPDAPASSSSFPSPPSSSSSPDGPRRLPTPAIDPAALRVPGEQGAAAIPANARVAVIGDSHMAGVMGNTLKQKLSGHLEAGGGRLESFTGIPSAGVSQFMNGAPTQAGNQRFDTPHIDDVLKGKPDVLVVGLGSNMLGNGVDANKAQIARLLDKADAAGTKVTWVGPPNMNGFNGNLQGDQPEGRFYQALSEVNAERRAAGKPEMTIVDSRGSTHARDTSDGVHFAGAPAKAWADQVFTDATKGSAPGSAANGATGPDAPSSSSAANVSADELRRIVPNLSGAKADEVAQNLNVAMREAGITTPRQKAAFIAQLAHESGGFRFDEEIASGRAYEGRKDLGNTQPGDGERFKGRGYIQVTGRANYTAAGKALGLDLVNQPQLASKPENAARIAAWFWKSRGLNDVAERGDFREVTRRINGGFNGMEARQMYYDRAQQVLAGKDGLPGGDGSSSSSSSSSGSSSSNGGSAIVEAGDTLSRLAARHGTTVEELMRANPQLANPNRIYPGQKLNLPS